MVTIGEVVGNAVGTKRLKKSWKGRGLASIDKECRGGRRAWRSAG